MNSLTYQILTLVIPLIGVILTSLVVPLLKTKISNEKLTSIELWVNIAVAAAEQMKAAGILTVPKKDYVVKFLKDKGVTITDQELDALIEAAVFEINKAKNLLFTDLALQGETEATTETDQV
ncbi:MAG: phage holin, LLH family [Rikenellaceae bacterium]